MKIIISARFFNLPKTGIGRYCVNLFHELQKMFPKNHYNLVSNQPIDAQLIHNKSNCDITVIPFKKYLLHKDLRKTYWEMSQFRRHVVNNQDSIVHLPYISPHFFKRNKVVITIHDLWPLICPLKQTGYKGIYDKVHTKFVKRALQKADHVITVSESSKKDIIKFLRYPEEKITVVYHGVEDYFRPVGDKTVVDNVRNKFKLEREYILYLGDISVRKNLDGLLRAYHNLPDDVKDFYDLVLAGRAKFSQTLRCLAASLDPEKVKFLGFVDNNDIAPLYSAASLFVFPSILEGFGLPVLEAMSCGTPVIGSNSSSIPEVAGDAGVLVDVTDIEALTNAMHRVVTDTDLRSSMIRKGLVQAEKFSWRKTARETYEIYRKLCE